MGCRALSDQEINDIKEKFTRQRDRTLFVLGNRTGWRISQLLSIKIKHLYKNGKLQDCVAIDKMAVKGKKKSQSCMLHPEAKIELEKLLVTFETLDPEFYLFKSTVSPSQRNPNKAISRIHAHYILKGIVEELGLSGKIATHSMRKSLASKVYKASGNDLLLTQQALNHVDISSTIKYLTVAQEEVDDILLKL